MAYGLVSARVGYTPPPPTLPSGWQVLKLGAGGQLTGIDIAADGTKVVRADTHGAYWWNGSAWVQLVDSTRMPSPIIADPYSSVQGAYEIRIAPSNTSRFYMFNNASIYTTTNRGVNWTKTAFAGLITAPGYAASNDKNSKFFGFFMAVDPANELIVYTGTPADGVWHTSNGNHLDPDLDGDNRSLYNQNSRDSDQNGGNLIAFDPLSSHPGNITQTIYASTYGVGVYKSSNGGSSWTLLNSAGMPTTVKKMIVGPDQFLYCIEHPTSNLKVYNGTSWTNYVVGTGYLATSLAFNPANSSHLVVVSQDGTMTTTTTGAAGTWSGYQTTVANVQRAATDIPWLAAPFVNYITAAMIAFDPTQSNVLYLTAGIGVFKTGNTTISNISTTVVTWTSQSAGIEQLVGDLIISPPGGSPVFAVWDRPIFTLTDLTQYPTFYGPAYVSVSEGFSLDYASTSPNVIVALCSDTSFSSNNQISYSSTGGTLPWTTASAHPGGGSGRGGAIAAQSASNFVVANLFGGIYYTINAGSTWLNPTIVTGGTSITNTDAGWYSVAEYFKMQNVCADRVLANTFYAHNSGATAPGIYVSTDSGLTFTRRFSGQIEIFDGAHEQLRSVPGQSGNFYYTSGTTNMPNNPGFYEFNWNGTALTKATVSGVTNVWAFGFGKVKPGNTYPSIYVYGKVAGVFGIYRSDDHCVTWTSLTGAGGNAQFVNNSMDQVASVNGDMNTYGICYVLFNGSGGMVYFP